MNLYRDKVRLSLAQAIDLCNSLGAPYAVQKWGENDYIVAHGVHDGIGMTVYATLIGRRIA